MASGAGGAVLLTAENLEPGYTRMYTLTPTTVYRLAEVHPTPCYL